MEPDTSRALHDATMSRRGFMHATAAVAAVAAAPALTGCSDSDGGGNDALSDKGKPVPGGPESTPNPDVLYPDDYVGPIASNKGVITTERAELTVVVPERVTVGDWMTNEFTKWYEERTNVHVNFKTIAGGSREEQMTKVNAMLSSGDMPDVFMGMRFTPSQLRLYGEDQQLFAPLNDIIDEYCPEIRKIFEDYPDARNVYTAPDGNIYTLPNIRDTFHTYVGQHRAWIYKPWLDKLGLSMPETLDEFTEVLRAFKTKDPNGNGAADEIAFTSGALPNGQAGTFDEFIMGSFLYNPGPPWLVLDNGKVDVVYDKPQWREGLKYLNQLYAEGLIPKEGFTQTSEQLKRQGAADPVTLGVVRQYYWNGFLNIDYTDPNARWRDYVCVPTLQGPDGARVAGWDYYRPYQHGVFVVTKASKIPEIATMWGDGLYELEATLRAGRGVRDTNWRWAQEGETGMDGRQAVWSALTVWPADPGLSWHETGPEYYANDIRVGLADDPENPSFEPVLYNEIKDAYYPHREPKEQCLPNNLAMSRQDAGQVADIETTLANHVLQSMTRFALGELDPNNDTTWTEYVETLNSMGLADYLAIQQRAYDEVSK